ncbi:hypothetical protein ACH5RR_016953 [Cinchona calisaya]|uniref:Sulfotransferase n=1 Tax=Cinchona calisaya TaxID=153742 RepID=A0ABD2ZYI8_9GENT
MAEGEEGSSIQSSHNSQADDAFLNELPRARFWDGMDICQWEGGWFEPGLIKPAMTFKTTFEAHNDDVLLVSPPKTGTTWLKALCLCITQNPSTENATETDDILVKENPHFNIQTIESMIYSTKPHPDLYSAPSPRLFHTHLPYKVLPDSIKNNSDCKIVYITRNPKDTIISLWHFFNSIFRPNLEPFPLEKAVECFCNGVHQYGPFFDHVLEYWLESQKRPNKILFLRYEELKRDPKGEVKKLASFLGKPFVNEEEVEKVLWRCSLERLRNLDVNKNGSILYGVPNSSYFRRGVVGDWKNYLSPELQEQINRTARSKFEGSSLDLDA